MFITAVCVLFLRKENNLYINRWLKAGDGEGGRGGMPKRARFLKKVLYKENNSPWSKSLFFFAQKGTHPFCILRIENGLIYNLLKKSKSLKRKAFLSFRVTCC